MKCPKCQTQLPDSAKFCMACGRSLQTELVCANCNHANPVTARFCLQCGRSLTGPEPQTSPSIAAAASIPASFANGRYQVKKFLGEGGKKKVYLAQDTVLDRDVAFALIKTEKLDAAARTRIKREVQSMGRLGDHPNIVNVYDFGDHEGQPFIVLPLLSGGDVEGLIKKATDHKLPLDRCIEIAESVCKGLEFAHGKGIIHRDIKPGNVWLNADGIAQIGDFGLAVAVDLSRLTQAGMMVGTVSYMPPEQAMGGEVTAKADLYSLGAMLYEMVTGRPPFVGDDSVAIIGQHINTPPVSPSWHRADLPPALETLIMQLLEKDPDKRPASSTVVLQALESIIAAKPSREPTKKTSAPAENPLYRRVFVGREQELKQLQSAFDGAVSGQGALMMVLGEPGIGKTALCEQLATYVTLRGGRTLVGHCYEEGSLSLPYLAFVEAMRSHVLSREVKDLRDQLGTGAADVARIVSEIREKLKVKVKAQKDPEEERYRLMQAVTGFLTNAAAVQPLVVVLEDLHDADKGTLDMLTHVSRNLSGARLLIVGTYRDVEVDRTHPLSAALAELRRVSSFGRVVLRGLNADEVKRMLDSITQENVPWSLAEAVHRQTEGNPLFVQEVVRFLAEEGLITRKGGRWSPTKDTPVEMSIPEGLRDVIGKRLSLLSAECNQLLSVAAVIGREFRLDLLQKVAGLSDEELYKNVEEAKKAVIIEERARIGAAVTYRFSHAFFRQTLYEETIAPRRIRLHLQVGRVLEEIYGKRLDEHAAELAEHFSHSSDSADLKKAVGYGEMAARRAMDVFAAGEAVRLLDQAVKVQRVLDPDDKEKVCNLLLGTCDALLYVPDTRRILDTEAPTAFALAEGLGDGLRAARASTVALSAIIVEEGTVTSPKFMMWSERANLYAKPNTAERVIADSMIAASKLQTGEMRAGLNLLDRALELARSLNSNWGVLYYPISFLLWYLRAPHHTQRRLQLAEEAWSNRDSMSESSKVTTLGWVFDTFLSVGRRERAYEAASEIRTWATQSGVFIDTLYTAVADGVQALLDGHINEVFLITENIRTQGKEGGVQGLANMFAFLIDFRAQIYTGTFSEIPEFSLGSQRDLYPCLMHAHLGHKQAVSEKLEQSVVARPGIGTTEDETLAIEDIAYLEAAVVIGHKRAAKLLLDRLGSAGLLTPGWAVLTCIPRHFGGAAALLGRYDEARQHYKEAIRVCTEMRFRPELALTRLQLAELLLEHYPDEKKDALDHLDFAIKEFREMKMQPSLEQALRHKEILKA